MLCVHEGTVYVSPRFRSILKKVTIFFASLQLLFEYHQKDWNGQSHAGNSGVPIAVDMVLQALGHQQVAATRAMQLV